MFEIVRIETIPFVSKRQKIPRIRFYDEDNKRFLRYHAHKMSIHRMADYAINTLANKLGVVAPHYGMLAWSSAAPSPGQAGFKVTRALAETLPAKNIVIHFQSVPYESKVSRYEHIFGLPRKQF